MSNEDDWLGDVIDLQDHSLKGRFKRKIRNNSKSIMWVVSVSISAIFGTLGLYITYLEYLKD